jgi:hypothetical protein
MDLVPRIREPTPQKLKGKKTGGNFENLELEEGEDW